MESKKPVEKAPTANPEPVAKQWANIIQGNRTFGNGLNLEYTQPGIEVEISAEEWSEGGKLWKFPLVGKVLKSRPPYTEVLK